jgi:hypothetical protein
MKLLYTGMVSLPKQRFISYSYFLNKYHYAGEVGPNRSPYPVVLVTGYGVEGWHLVVGMFATASRPTPVALSSGVQ